LVKILSAAPSGYFGGLNAMGALSTNKPAPDVEEIMTVCS
jgi:hypothetical protein